MNPADSDTDILFFTNTLKQRKLRADDAITAHWQKKLADIHAEYGEASWHSMQAFNAILSRGGKRIRAALGETGYSMHGGHDQRTIDGMSLVLETVHAYLLITDDISDRSDLRRGGPSAHRILEDWYTRENLGSDEQHFGANIANLAAMTGLHEALVELTKLPVAPERIVAAVENSNRLLTATCHGQINDLWNEASGTQDQQEIENVLIWKTAFYSFVNPLQLGAILAGATDEQLEVLRQYGMHAGRAFQISDDILSLFSSELSTGKNAMDDIREGKRTLLVAQALQKAPPDSAAFLSSQLGNSKLSVAAFEKCRRIIADCGALDSVKAELASSCSAARRIASDGFPAGDQRRFLLGLAEYLLTRQS